MQATTELCENRPQMLQEGEDQQQLLQSTTVTKNYIKPNNYIPPSLTIETVSGETTSSCYENLSTTTNNKIKAEDDESAKKSDNTLFYSTNSNNNKNSSNFAKINWWYTPYKPLTIETIVDQQHEQQQNYHEKVLEEEENNLLLQEHRNGILNNSIKRSSVATQQQQLHYEELEHVQRKHDDFDRFDDGNKYSLNDIKQSCFGFLNRGEEDEMQITGYRRCPWRTALCWIGICLTAGLLRLILHWWKHLYLQATHTKCDLSTSEKVLIKDNYLGKHTTYFVKSVQQLEVSSINDQTFKIVDKSSTKTYKKKDIAGNLTKLNIKHFSIHFVGEHFEHKQTVRLLICKHLRYVWNDETKTFLKIRGLDAQVSSAYFHQQQGLSGEEQLSRRLIYGYNDITIPYSDTFTLLFLEALNPFYVFQLFSVILWCTYNYYYYASVIFIMSVVSVSMSVAQTKKNQDRLRSTLCDTGETSVLNEKGSLNVITTQLLVPGDIIEIPTTGCVMQCDAVLLSGNCILDEAMLTGESVPITKTPLPLRRDIIYDKKEHSRHTLFSGTKVIQTRYIGSEKVLAFVTNTGNITSKGGLVRSILYPPPVDYKFEQDSYKFIAWLAVIACIGFIYTIVSKIIRQVDVTKIIVESLDLITIVVPPALPAAMTVGRVYAQQRLKENEVYCISPRAINVAGSINCCCFDKTGTLTEDGLDMWGVVPKTDTNQFQIPMRQVDRLPANHFLFAMVTCHSITIMEGKKMGDPLDLKMFESTGWILEDSKEVPDSQKYGLLQPTIVRQPSNDEIIVEDCIVKRQNSIDDLLADVGLLNGERSNDHGIVREFPFSSSLQRMSVVTRRLSESHFNVYCKGAPEMLKQLCASETLPDNYMDQLAYFAKQGYRIIALAFKSLPDKVTYTKVQRLLREQVECELQFLGFVILENRLKPDTEEVITKLRAAKLRTIMVTGDNLLTALSVGRDCGMLQADEPIITVNTVQKSNEHYELYFHMEPGYQPQPSQQQQENVGGAVQSLTNSHTTLSLLPDSQSYTSMRSFNNDWTPNFDDTTIVMPTNNWLHNYRFALTGDTWEILRNYYPNILQRILTRGVIYARMSPEQKQFLIQELQAINYCVSMCGDGANDCGALKVAHTGISLSETESSIASPFTAHKPTIAAVLEVIKEGRAALATSFGIFKYMATYSIIQFVSVMILYSIDANLSDKQFLYIDIGLISIFAFFFSKTSAFDGSLSAQVPLSSLIALAPLTSLISHLISVVLFQVAAWFLIQSQPWFTHFQPTNNDLDTNYVSYENYIMFAISSFQYIIMAFVYSKGPPYRRPIWSNIPFCLSLLINTALIICMLIFPPDWLSGFFDLKLPPDTMFRYALLAYVAIMFIVHLLIEELFVEYFIFKRVQIPRANHYLHSTQKYLQLEYKLQHEWSHWPPITETLIPTDKNLSVREENLESQLPAYVELSAEPQHKMEMSVNPVLNSFFDP